MKKWILNIVVGFSTTFKFLIKFQDRVTIFSGIDDIRKYGIIDKYNGKSHLPHWLSEECNRLNGTDGSIFPPHITPNTTLYIYDKDLCRLLPLVYEKDVITRNDVKGMRFTPASNVFADVETNPDNMCFCPAGPPCAPNGLFNVSLCQYGEYKNEGLLHYVTLLIWLNF